MHINAQTKIAALLKGHPDALETIVALRPDFKKLRNPLLRKVMAGRTSIAEAAKIGGCEPDDFSRVLAPLGFEADGQSQVKDEVTPEKPAPVFLLQQEAPKLVTLDVRPMLAEGADPLKLIQQTVKNLQADQVLHIINTFEPTPLIRLLEKQGFAAYVQRGGDGVVETYFQKEGEASQQSVEVVATDDWEVLLNRFDGKLQEIDVRHLEMPGPMMTILESLDKLEAGTALFVHHKRVPVYLLSELKDRGFDYRIKEEGEGQVKLLVFNDGAKGR